MNPSLEMNYTNMDVSPFFSRSISDICDHHTKTMEVVKFVEHSPSGSHHFSHFDLHEPDRSLPRMRLPFPYKLHEMLEYVTRRRLDDIVSWHPQGKAFRVHQPAIFATTIMPLFFNQTKYKSFQRQLHMYGFRRVVSNKAHHSRYPDDDSISAYYYHDKFVRGDQELSLNMTRKVQQTAVPAGTTTSSRHRCDDIVSPRLLIDDIWDDHSSIRKPSSARKRMTTTTTTTTTSDTSTTNMKTNCNVVMSDRPDGTVAAEDGDDVVVTMRMNPDPAWWSSSHVNDDDDNDDCCWTRCSSGFPRCDNDETRRHQDESASTMTDAVVGKIPSQECSTMTDNTTVTTTRTMLLPSSGLLYLADDIISTFCQQSNNNNNNNNHHDHHDDDIDDYEPLCWRGQL